jgi:predicted aspartyl protease
MSNLASQVFEQISCDAATEIEMINYHSVLTGLTLRRAKTDGAELGRGVLTSDESQRVRTGRGLLTADVLTVMPGTVFDM